MKDGPKRGFVKQELQIDPPETELPPEGIRWFETKLINTPIIQENDFQTLFRNRKWGIQVGLKSRLFCYSARTVLLFFPIKVVFKMRQNCSLKSTLIFEVKSISCLEIKVWYEIRQNSHFITTRVLSYFRKYTSFASCSLACSKTFLEMIMITYGTQQYKVSKEAGQYIKYIFECL